MKENSFFMTLGGFSIKPQQLLLWQCSKNKESVELFVYLVIGIWRRPSTNKQYPTLVQYGVGTEHANTSILIQVMSVIALLVLLKSPNFITKD